MSKHAQESEEWLRSSTERIAPVAVLSVQNRRIHPSAIRMARTRNATAAAVTAMARTIAILVAIGITLATATMPVTGSTDASAAATSVHPSHASLSSHLHHLRSPRVASDAALII